MSAQVNFGESPQVMKSGGIGLWLVLVCYTAMIGFIMANTYHTDNFLTTMLGAVRYTLFSFIVSYISFALCLSEIPLSKSIVTDYRFNGDKINFKIVLKSVLGIAIACLAMAGTLNSQKMNASLIDSEVSSHQTASSGYELDKKALDNQWRSDTRKANKIKSTEDRKIRIDDINTAYYQDLSALTKSKSKHQATKPAQSYQVGSWGHTITSALLAFVCSFGLMFVSGFLTVYHYPITPKALMSLITKKDHDYTSNASNIQMMNHQFSPLVKGVVFSWLSNRLLGSPTPPPATQNQETVQPQNDDAKKRPQPDATGLGAVESTNHNDGIRTPNDEPEKGAKFRAINTGDITEAKRAVMAGDLSPTIKPVKEWLLNVRRVGISDKARQETAKKLLDGMAKEGILILNPEQQHTKQILAKYVLASSVTSESKQSDIKLLDLPEWIGKATESDLDGIPLFTFERRESMTKKGFYKLAILTPDRKHALCVLNSESHFDMGEMIREGQSIPTYGFYDFKKAQEDYRQMDHSEQDKQPEVIAADEMGPYDIETRCVKSDCGAYNYTRVDQLYDKQNGIVECSECHHKYVGASHITSNSKSIDQAEKDLANDSAVKTKTGRAGGIIPAAGVGVSIDENGISPAVGIGAGIVGGKS